MLFGTVRSKYVMMEPMDPRRKRFRPSARITSEEVFDFLRATGRRKNQSTKGNSGTPEVDHLAGAEHRCVRWGRRTVSDVAEAKHPSLAQKPIAPLYLPRSNGRGRYF
jgi:hypothetical protein